MKKISVFLGLALLLGLASSAFAASNESLYKCPPSQHLGKIGNVQTKEALVDSNGHEVVMIAVTCGSTACVATIYDADSPATEAIEANIMIEPGAIASTSGVFTFLTPLTFVDGIYVGDDGNVAAVQLYECVPD